MQSVDAFETRDAYKTRNLHLLTLMRETILQVH